jgi:hypothetical protein
VGKLKKLLFEIIEESFTKLKGRKKEMIFHLHPIKKGKFSGFSARNTIITSRVISGYVSGGEVKKKCTHNIL